MDKKLAKYLKNNPRFKEIDPKDFPDIIAVSDGRVDEYFNETTPSVTEPAQNSGVRENNGTKMVNDTPSTPKTDNTPEPEHVLASETKPENKTLWKLALAILLVTIFSVGGLTYYVNSSMPHGESYATGDVSCQGERGPCAEEYKEYLPGLNIPDWAKFLRGYGIGILFISGIAAIYVYKVKIVSV